MAVIEISNIDELDAVGNDLAGDYEVAKHIDASATETWNAGAGFDPIGSFTGTFDGRGFVVSGLFIDRNDVNQQSLFYQVDGTVQNLGVVDANITGRGNVGILTGVNHGSISRCYTSGVIYGTHVNIGGLVGANWSSIQDCYSVADVYAVGNQVGGLVGRQWEGSIALSYSAGPVDGGSSSIGGLVGDKVAGTVTNSYWDTETSGQSTSAGGTGKTTAEMQDIDTYTVLAAWDMVLKSEHDGDKETAIWFIDDGEDYPRLWWERLVNRALLRRAQVIGAFQ